MATTKSLVKTWKPLSALILMGLTLTACGVSEEEACEEFVAAAPGAEMIEVADNVPSGELGDLMERAAAELREAHEVEEDSLAGPGVAGVYDYCEENFDL